jgi:hypothetical protein
MVVVRRVVRELEHVVRDGNEHRSSGEHRERGGRVGEVDPEARVQPTAEERAEEAAGPGEGVVEAERAPPRRTADQADEEERARGADERQPRRSGLPSPSST